MVNQPAPVPVVGFVRLQGEAYRIKKVEVGWPNRKILRRRWHELVDDGPTPIDILVHLLPNRGIKLEKRVPLDPHPTVAFG